jgi:hypothetical protein
MRGEFDVAAFQAMNAVEASVRAASGLGDNLIGVKLMHEALRKGRSHGAVCRLGGCKFQQSIHFRVTDGWLAKSSLLPLWWSPPSKSLYTSRI